MRTIFLNEEQYHYILENADNQLVSPIWFADAVAEKIAPLARDKEYINNSVMKMMEDAYKKSVFAFSDDITKFELSDVKDKLNKLILICQKKEEKIKDELEKLCSDIVLSAFKLNGLDFELECNLIKSVSNDKDFHIKPDTNTEIEYSDINEIDEEDSDEIRRRYTNAITIGAALELTDKLLIKCLEEIFELDEDLPHLYSKIIKINDYLLLAEYCRIDDKQNFQDAYTEITTFADSNKVKILSEGIIFPFLLTETIRGCIEALSFKTLPEKRAEFIISKCDVLKDEPLYMVLGRELWDKICGEDFDENYTESLLQKLFSIDTQRFNVLMDEILVGTKLGKDGIEKIKKAVKYDSDYQSFEDTLKRKREEKSLIIDGYFTEDDLNEGIIHENNKKKTLGRV